MTDGPSPETGGPLKGPGPPRRRRLATIVGAVALAGAGFGVGSATGHRGTGGPAGTTAVAAAGGMSPGWSVVTERQTADGIQIRVYEHSNPPDTYPDGWSPPRGCTAIGSIQADLSNARAVGIADAGVFDPTGPLAVIGAGVWGTTEGDPAAWAILHAGAGVTRVSVSFTGGGTDSTAPVNGWAVLSAPLDGAVPMGPGYFGPGGTAVGLDASGSQVATLDLPTAPAHRTPSAACQPPPPPPVQLPPPGPQPVDVLSARAAVTKAFLTLYSHAAQSVRFRYLQGADAAVAAAGAKAAANYSSLASATAPVVRGVVFTDATHATVLYQIDYQGHAVVGPKLGYAVVDSGVWKVTRASYCSDLDNGGGHC